MRMTTSHSSRHAAASPVVSLPITTIVGPRKSTARTSAVPSSPVPSTVTGRPADLSSASQASTSRGDAARSTGTLKYEPVLALMQRGSYGSAAWPVTTSPDPPNASIDLASVPILPGLAGRSNTTASRAGTAGMREKSSARIRATASSSGTPSDFSPSSAISSGATVNLCAGTLASKSFAHADGFGRPSCSSALIVQPWLTAWLMGRTPWTRNSPARCRLVRLVSRDSHCWNVALRVVTLPTPASTASRPGWARQEHRAVQVHVELHRGKAVARSVDGSAERGEAVRSLAAFAWVADVAVLGVLDLADPLAGRLRLRDVGAEVVPAARRPPGQGRAGDAVLAAAELRGREARVVHVALLDDGAVRVAPAPPAQERRVLPQARHAEPVDLVERVGEKVLRVAWGEVEARGRRRVEAVDVVEFDGVEALARAHPQPRVDHRLELV